MAEKQPEHSSENRNKTDFAQKLQDLRQMMRKKKIDAYLIPKEDEWQGEYLPARAERLVWMSGFTGSDGTGIVTQDKACVFTDGRYETQVRDELAGTPYDPQDRKPGEYGPEDWLVANLADGDVVGYDPRLYTVSGVAALKAKLEGPGKHITLKPVKQNLVDAIWTDQPAFPREAVRKYPHKMAGKNSLTKRKEIAKTIAAAGADSFFIAAPDSIAWLLNIRGNDVPMTPFALSFAVLHADASVDWFVQDGHLDDTNKSAIEKHIGTGLRVHAIDGLDKFLKTQKKKAVFLDRRITPQHYLDVLTKAKAKPVYGTEPCQTAKAVKTKAEQESIKAVHVQDGVAVTKFLKWVDDNAPKGKLTEIDVENKLRSYRQDGKDYEQDSFGTIAGWAGNGAVIHYHATPDKHKKIKGKGLLLVDSGGQYKGGTTDITRTMAVGKPTKAMCENFTRVLKGHIRIANLRFPEGTQSGQIDVLARAALWQDDLDYKHGTGHGVGCNLSVHEGGAGIASSLSYIFKAGMLVSNEPGYYEKDKYGIRIENLIMVEDDGRNKTTDRVMLRFNTVSLAPLDRRLIVADMLSDDEVAWLNEYHSRVYQEIAPHLDQDEKAWLREATQPITRGAQTPAAKPSVS